MRDRKQDDRQDGPAMQVPEIPPIRNYLVTREREDGFIIDQRTIAAHEFEVFPAGVSLRTYHIHPEHGATFTLRTILRPSSGWMEIEELLVEPTSALLLGPSGVSLQ